MADYIISPYAISFTNIKESLQAYIKNKSYVSWTDFYTAGAGETIIELDAAIAAFYAFHFIIGRREAYLPTAQNYASVVGGAQTIGYCASRGHNLKIAIDIIAANTQTLAKWTIVGSYADYDLVLDQPAILNAGEKTTIYCTIGNSAAQQITISTKDLQQFTFTANDTTDDCRLILNETEVPFTTNIEEAIYDNWIMITNSFGSVDVFYLNEGDYKYSANDILYLHYLERNNIKYGSFNPSNLSVDIATQVDDVILVSDQEDVEDIEHIRMAAPIKRETNNVVRARKDYSKYLLELNPNIIDVNDLDINPGLIALTYLKAPDGNSVASLLTEEEKTEYIKTIQKLCPDGVAKAIIEDPIRVVRSLAISLWNITGQNISVTIDDDIDTILDNYRNKLHPTFELEQIEHEIEQLPGIKVARVDIGASEYENNKKYKLYDVIEVPNVQVGDKYETWMFYCGKVQAATGSTEPDWVQANTLGSTIVDNNLVWQNTNKYPNNIAVKWEEDGSYELYSDINVGYTIPEKCTAGTEPTWGNSFINDGNVTATLCTTYDLLDGWVGNTSKKIGDRIIVHNEDNYCIYKVKELTIIADEGSTGTTEPIWFNEEFQDNISDNDIVWTIDTFSIGEDTYNSIGTIWKANSPFEIGDIWIQSDDEFTYIYRITYVSDIPAVVSNKIYSVVNYAGTTGTQLPEWGPDNVVDNDILWTKTTNTSEKIWEPNKQMRFGTIISTLAGYYTFSSVLGTSGSTRPNWEGIKNNAVEDNNITWYRILNTTSIPLAWNEYLDLSFTSKIVG